MCDLCGGKKDSREVKVGRRHIMVCESCYYANAWLHPDMDVRQEMDDAAKKWREEKFND